MTRSDRTIGLGHRFSLAVIASELGLGEKRKKQNHLPCGWFVSAAELEQIEAERARRLDASREERLARCRARAKSYATPRPTPRPPRERAIAAWRNEWLDPLSPRKTPEQCWEYAARFAFDLDEDDPVPPMPREKLPPRPALHADRYARRAVSTDLSLLRPGTVRSPE